MKTMYPECGRIVNTHGCRGELKIESYCDTPEVLCSLPAVYLYENGTYCKRKLTNKRIHKGYVLAFLENVTDMNQAASLKNTILYAARDDIPLRPGAALLCDLCGLPVIDADTGRVYGTVTDTERGIASDLYTVKTENGEVLFPAVPQFIVSIDPERGIFIRPAEGLFDDV